MSGNLIITEERWKAIIPLTKAKWPRKQEKLSNLHWNIWKKL